MASRTSTTSGPLSANGTWVGGVAPVNGDTIIIASGHTVNVDTNITLGDKAVGVGHAFSINGASNVSFGTLTVDDGINLTLRGFDRTTNSQGSVARYGKFLPSPGATITLDSATAGQSCILGAGIINMIGTSSKHITVTSTGMNWNNSATYTPTGQPYASYDLSVSSSMYTWSSNRAWLSNAAGTGIGSFGDSSVSFTTVSPAGILATEVATVEEVNGIGKYWVDYKAGVFVWWQVSGASSYTINYKYLSTLGSTIQHTTNQTYCEGVYRYVDFNYMGEVTFADDYVVHFNNRRSDGAGGVSQRAEVTNCTFNYCYRCIGAKNHVGTLADPCPKIEDNQFLDAGGDIYGHILMFYRAGGSYLSFQRNICRTANTVIMDNAGAAQSVHTGYVIKDNISKSGGAFFACTPYAHVFPDCVIENNLVLGHAGAYDTRGLAGFGGSSTNHAIARNNLIQRIHRGHNVASYEDFEGNVISDCYHHGINAYASEDNLPAIDINIEDNIITRGHASLGSIEIGYNRMVFMDNWVVKHNTSYLDTSGSGFSFGDHFDNSGTHAINNIDVVDNLFVGNQTGTRRATDGANNVTHIHTKRFDYNNQFGNTSAYAGINKQGTFKKGGVNYNTDATRNIIGAAIHDPSYAATFSNKALVYTYNSATDVTLAWDGGVAVQLIQDSGTATAGANTSYVGVAGLKSGTITDTGKAWSTTRNNAGTLYGRWVVITGGTGAGQVRRITSNTATVATVAPGWTTVPDATSTYTIWKPEVQTFDSGAVDYVRVGLDVRVLPTSTQTDSGISLEFNNLTLDPDFVDETRSMKTWDSALGGSGTELGAWNRLVADPTLLGSSLLPYIKNGYKIQNATLATAASDGTYVGAMDLVSSGGTSNSGYSTNSSAFMLFGWGKRN